MGISLLFLINSRWSENEEFCEIQNMKGEHFQILFRKEGCVINGVHNDYNIQRRPSVESITPAIKLSNLSIITKIPLKDVSFSDFIATFAMSCFRFYTLV